MNQAQTQVGGSPRSAAAGCTANSSRATASPAMTPSRTKAASTSSISRGNPPTRRRSIGGSRSLVGENVGGTQTNDLVDPTGSGNVVAAYNGSGRASHSAGRPPCSAGHRGFVAVGKDPGREREEGKERDSTGSSVKLQLAASPCADRSGVHRRFACDRNSAGSSGASRNHAAICAIGGGDTRLKFWVCVALQSRHRRHRPQTTAPRPRTFTRY